VEVRGRLVGEAPEEDHVDLIGKDTQFINFLVMQFTTWNDLHRDSIYKLSYYTVIQFILMFTT